MLKLAFLSNDHGDRWAVIPCLPETADAYKGYTKVIDAEGSRSFKLWYGTVPLPAAHDYLAGLTIDPAGTYLYLNIACACIIDPAGDPNWFFGYATPLYRLDLSSGKLVALLPAIDDNDYYFASSISPNFHYLFYATSREPNTVFIRNLVTGAHNTFQLENRIVITGGARWSPDGKYLVFAAGVRGWDHGKAGISIYRLNLRTMDLQPLLVNDKRRLVPWFEAGSSQEWLAPSVLSLASLQTDQGILTDSTDQWSMNVDTGQVILLATPTPGP